VGVQVGVWTGAAGAEVATAVELGVTVGLGEGEASPGSGVGLRVGSSGVDEGEAVGSGVSLPADGMAVGEGDLVAVARPVAVGTALVGPGDGEGGVADGSGGEVGAGGGLVGSRVAGLSVGLAVGGLTVGLGGVFVGTVWLGRSAWAVASLPAPQASSRMASIPRMAKVKTRLSSLFSFMVPPLPRGRRSRTHDRFAGRWRPPADRPARLPPPRR
jgi:hypothetical protein